MGSGVDGSGQVCQVLPQVVMSLPMSESSSSAGMPGTINRPEVTS